MSCQNKVVFEFTSFSLFWQEITAPSGSHESSYGAKILSRIKYLVLSCLILSKKIVK